MYGWFSVAVHLFTKVKIVGMVVHADVCETTKNCELILYMQEFIPNILACYCYWSVSGSVCVHT